ncbi:hypothetical protein SMACR_02150 [Sordaria macrospora]|uniref:WGS project CABT00000000 data, contig 2.18 n=2 Tax=Sordaria macrospora TaxID=5147 RepID=F7W140_SORMK|nr:uncharacterized protein SMAC_02150 [Sordaria macrospora k-hell]KAA8633302.1 hypothetical protein SMACR_02150 [Sordaria macrospora]WPJ63763.1 hypothetical protein SMAC4_02150 [Sordaria macrospora]CCC11492.1 unnamed protein product [Sordaria macrospora k-hell]
MAPKSAERSSKSVESAESTTETTDKHFIREALNHMPLPNEKDLPQYSVSHYEVRDYSHMFEDGTTIVIEKRPSGGTLSLWDYIRLLEQSEDLEPRSPLRYDIGNWLGHFHNWGSQEQVVEKLQGIVRNQELTNDHCEIISAELNMAVFEALNRPTHQLPKHAHKTFEEALGLIKKNYAVHETQQSFQILNGKFDLHSLHVMDSPLTQLDDPKQSPSVYVSEWRGCHEGHPAFDLGPFMADLVVLFRQNNPIAGDVARGFVNGYFDKVRENRDPGNKFIFYVLVHIGVYIIIRCRGFTQKMNDYSTGKDKNIGENKNTTNDENTTKDENNGKVKNKGKGKEIVEVKEIFGEKNIVEEKKIDKGEDTGKYGTSGKDNAAKDQNNGRQNGNSIIDGDGIKQNGNRNGTPADNDNNDPKHTTNGTNGYRETLKYGFLIVQHALSEDSEWFMDKPLLCHLFGLSSASSSKVRYGPDRWALANKLSRVEKSGESSNSNARW